MTRRRTSVIGPGRAPAQATPGAEPQQLQHWGLVAARELSLDLQGQAQAEADKLSEVRRRWRIARGREGGNPAPSSGRSEVTRISSGSGPAFWRKHFKTGEVRWQLNEVDVLNYLGTTDRNSLHGLREHVGWMRQVNTRDQGSALQTVDTLDAGPSLDDWQEFAPCSLVQGLPLPLFCQAEYLAALTRQALIGLDKLADFDVVHNDLKPSNLCLALPQGFQRKGNFWQASLNLQQLPLRFIDFELAFRPQVRLLQAHDNPWVSPFAKGCHRAAATQADADDARAMLSGIDWGADLWSLGFMLGEWVQSAQHFLDAWLNAVRLTWGDTSPVYLTAGNVVAQQARGLGPLRRMAAELQAQDRPVGLAGQTRLPARQDRPHGALRLKLEAAFPALAPGARRSEVALTMIDPEAPLKLAPTGNWSAPWKRRAREACAALKLRRKSLFSGTAAVAIAAGLWANAGAAFAWSSARYADLSYHLANAWRAQGYEWQASLLKQAAHVHLPSASLGVTRSVAEEPAWEEPTGDALAAAQDARLRSLRGLALLGKVLAVDDSADTRAQVERLLLKLYAAQNRIETLGAGRAGAEDVNLALNHARAALAVLKDRWPLAAMMALRLRACYEADPGDLAPLAAQLAAVPASAPSAQAYRSYARAVQERLVEHEPPCLIPTASAATP